MSTIVTVALAIIVLLAVGVFFSGGFGGLGSKLGKFANSSTGDEASIAATGEEVGVGCLNHCLQKSMDDTYAVPAACGVCPT